ncbi:AAA family ATPase [Bizionia sediminis]|uniref:AAA family ATPase n=1 Tax=Bizionia sediminis TaxID=1737064 RepID=A0ABW5KPH7_9FLAO
MQETQKIVITGGPGTGKTSIINDLKKRGYVCFDEISRDITLKAREDGIEQLFLTKPLLFSELLLEGRKKQYLEAEKQQTARVFLDRGIPDILAYMDFIGDTYPKTFEEHCSKHPYNTVFLLKPWEAIFVSDRERYENFEQAVQIYHQLQKTYAKFGYQLLDVPFGSVEQRTTYILDTINNL